MVDFSHKLVGKYTIDLMGFWVLKVYAFSLGHLEKTTYHKHSEHMSLLFGMLVGC